MVTLAPAPDGSSTFTGWSGEECSGTGTCQVTMDGAKTITATFSSSVVTTDQFPASVTLETGAVKDGNAASLAANDNVFYMVKSSAPAWWASFAGVDSAAASLAVTYSGKASIACTQVISMWRWTDDSWVPLDSRTVSSEAEVVILVPPEVLADYVSGTTGPGEVRVQVVCSTTGATLNLSGDLMKLTVGSSGTATTHALTVAKAGTGGGSVTSSPDGIACGDDCTEDYDAGTMVTLAPAPDGSSTFTGWSGEECSGTGTCQVTMDGAKTITATFSSSVVTTDQFPASVTLETGAVKDGNAASLAANDNVFYMVKSSAPAWWASFAGVDSAAASLAVTYSGKASIACTQVISMWRWTDDSWVPLDSRTVSSEAEVVILVPPEVLADYVSGTTGPGEVRVQVVCSNTGATLNLSGDLMKLTVGSSGT